MLKSGKGATSAARSWLTYLTLLARRACSSWDADRPDRNVLDGEILSLGSCQTLTTSDVGWPALALRPVGDAPRRGDGQRNDHETVEGHRMAS